VLDEEGPLVSQVSLVSGIIIIDVVSLDSRLIRCKNCSDYLRHCLGPCLFNPHGCRAHCMI